MLVQVRAGQDSVNKKQDAVYPGADKAHAAFECAAALRDSKGAQDRGPSMKKKRRW